MNVNELTPNIVLRSTHIFLYIDIIPEVSSDFHPTQLPFFKKIQRLKDIFGLHLLPLLFFFGFL